MHLHAPDTSRGRLLGTLALTAVVMVVEALGGVASSSLALLADAGHMLTDVLALAVAIAAITYGARPADWRRTWGYRRLEVLAALLNSLALLGVCGSIAIAAVGRWLRPQAVATGTMMQVALVGLLANVLGLALLRRGRANLNVRGAFLHLVGDFLSSVGVLVGGATIRATGWLWLDPLLSLGISVIVLLGALRLLAEVVEVLLEAAPRHLDTRAIDASIRAVPGVADVHALRVWSITQGATALCAHVVLTPAAGPGVRAAVQARLQADYAIAHATLQVEEASEPGCRGACG